MSRGIPDKRQAILAAALELIAEHGFHGAPTALIAERAQVGVGSIYRYFADKDALIHALHREVEEEMRRTILGGYDRAGSTRERFLHLATRLLLFFVENAPQFRFLEQYYNSPYGIALKRELLLAEGPLDAESYPLFSLFESGKSEGILKEFPMGVLCALAIGPLVFMARDHHSGFLHLDAPAARSAVEAAWDAIRR